MWGYRHNFSIPNSFSLDPCSVVDCWVTHGHLLFSSCLLYPTTPPPELSFLTSSPALHYFTLWSFCSSALLYFLLRGQSECFGGVAKTGNKLHLADAGWLIGRRAYNIFCFCLKYPTFGGPRLLHLEPYPAPGLEGLCHVGRRVCFRKPTYPAVIQLLLGTKCFWHYLQLLVMLPAHEWDCSAAVKAATSSLWWDITFRW